MELSKSPTPLLGINHARITPLVERGRDNSANDITISQLDQTASYLQLHNSDEKLGFNQAAQPIMLSYHDQISLRNDGRERKSQSVLEGAVAES